jgi:hypothetical protein
MPKTSPVRDAGPVLGAVPAPGAAPGPGLDADRVLRAGLVSGAGWGLAADPIPDPVPVADLDPAAFPAEVRPAVNPVPLVRAGFAPQPAWPKPPAARRQLRKSA